MQAIAPDTSRYHGRRVTVDEYFELPEDGHRYDMIEGVLYLASSAEFGSTRASNNFFGELFMYLKNNPVGFACSEQDIDLGDREDVLRPDVCFFTGKPFEGRAKRIVRIPSLVAESLSPSTRKRDLGIKAERYLQAGVLEYWLMDYRARRLELWSNVDGVWSRSRADSLESKVIPGFRVTTESLFD